MNKLFFLPLFQEDPTPHLGFFPDEEVAINNSRSPSLPGAQFDDSSAVSHLSFRAFLDSKPTTHLHFAACVGEQPAKPSPYHDYHLGWDKQDKYPSDFSLKLLSARAPASEGVTTPTELTGKLEVR